MTENEAIKQLKVGYLGDTEELVQAKHIAIKALEEIQQYRELGTVENLAKLKELYNKAKWLLDNERKIRRSYEAIGTIEEIKEKLSFLEKYEELGTVEELDEVLNMLC